MKLEIGRLGRLLTVLSIVSLFRIESASAQVIVPASDSTGTIVTPAGDRYDISGGQTSRDRANLFYSFQRFGLNQDQIANFLSNPATRNILGRVVGGEASVIDGLVRVTGSNANLFLMNPAGIVFGVNARLNVPAAFTATTADGIGFGNTWFSTIGSNDYAALVGTPTTFAFTLPQPGAIVNLGNLAVGTDQSLTLLGGTVLNTGQLSAPGGQITLAAVPGQNLVRLSQTGSLLSLEFQPMTGCRMAGIGCSVPTASFLPNPAALPQLLTGGTIGNASGVTVNPNGTIQLSGSGVQIPPATGTAIVAGKLNVSSTAPNQIGGTVNVLGDRVGIINAKINASGWAGGGTVRIGGDYQGKGSIFNAAQTVVTADSTIATDSLSQGNGGRVIVWADQTTQFEGKVSSRGGSQFGDGGFVEVSGKGNLLFRGTVDTSAVNGRFGTLLLDPTDITITAGGVGGGFVGVPSGVVGQVLFADIGPTVITQNQLQDLPGSTNVVLQASNNITIDPLTGGILTFAPGSGSITFQAGGAFAMNSADTIRASQRNLTIAANSVTLGTIDTSVTAGNFQNGGNVSITANAGNITATQINTSARSFFGFIGNGGNVTLNASNGSVSVTGAINSSSTAVGRFDTAGSGGQINLTSAQAGTISVGSIDAGTLALGDATSVGNGGSVALTGGSILTGNINSQGTISGSGSTVGNGGSVNLTVQSNLPNLSIITGDINASSPTANGGTINISSSGTAFNTVRNSVRTGNLTSTSTNGNGGNVNVVSSLDGTVSTVTGNINTASNAGNGGNISVAAFANIFSDTVAVKTGDLNTSSNTGNAGTVTIAGYAINTSNPIRTGNINASSNTGNGGNISVGNSDVYGIDSTVILTGNTTFNAGNATITFPRTRINAGANDLTLTADEIDFPATLPISGTGNLLFEPFSTDQTISLGGFSATGALDLTAAELGLLQNGFRSITIGRANGSSAITQAGNVTFSDPVTLRSPLGVISTTGFTLTGTDDASVTLIANSASSGAITTAGQDINIQVDRAAGYANFGAITSNGGNINITGFFDFFAGFDSGGGDINITGNGRIRAPLAIVTNNGDLNFSGFVTNNGLLANTLNLTLGSGNLSVAGFFEPVTTINNANNATFNGRVANGLTQLTGTGTTTFNALVSGGQLNLTSNGLAFNAAIETTGSVNLTAQNINTQNIRASDSINLIANQNINTQNVTASAGSIGFNAGQNINTQALTASGAVNLTANQNINTQGITALGQPVSITGATIVTGNINTSRRVQAGNGGAVSLAADDRITTGAIDTSAVSGNGGAVNIDLNRNVQVDFINTQGGANGRGGGIDIITDRFFLATGTFADRNGLNASLSSAGGLGGGAIRIRHAGSDARPFTVGNASSNGTAGAITSGSNVIAPTQSFPRSYTQGNIRLLTIDPPTQNQVIPPQNQVIPPTTTPAKVVTDAVTPPITVQTAASPVETAIAAPEGNFSQQFADYLGKDIVGETTSPENINETLLNITKQTGTKSAIVYVFVREDQLELAMFAPGIKPISKSIRVSRQTLLDQVKQFTFEVSDPRKTRTKSYLPFARQLYQWLIAPIEPDLQAQKINTLIFAMDTGLRSLPVAALHDDKQFLVEKYSLGLIPSISLTDTRYQSLKNAQVLAMGASTFSDLPSLPAVPLELSVITQNLWSGKAFLNESFTLENLKAQRQQQPYRIIHLATHGEFQSGALSNSYIRLWDSRLQLDQLRQLRWNSPPVELLVLSACRTAFGNEQAELGFAGIAFQSGVKSVLASLWYVSDEGTLGLMSEFYRQLKTVPIKAEALRQAQIAMLRGEVRLEAGQLRGSDQRGGVPLPPALVNLGNTTLSHPFYWAAFTMIGSPW